MSQPQEFQYLSRKQMTPRVGVKFATTYYKQSPREYALLRQHILQTAEDFVNGADNNNSIKTWLKTPLKGFKKTTGGNYTPEEIIADMVTQFASHKDVPSGMYGRWARLFENTRWAFSLVSGTPNRPTQYNELFEV